MKTVDGTLVAAKSVTTERTHSSIPGLEPAPTRHKRLVDWVDDIAALTKPDRVYWCDGSDAEWERLTDELVAPGTLKRLNSGQAPQLLLRRLRSARRRARRKPHLHLLGKPGRRRPDQQLDGAGRNARQAQRRCSTAACAAAPCMSCRSAWGRSARRFPPLGVEITDSAYVAISMRIMTRMGHARARADGRGRLLRARRPLARRAAGARPEGRRLALQRREVHRPFPRDPRDLVLRLGLWRQRPARQEVLRAAHRLGDGARRGLAGRAHADPQAHLAGRRA